MTAGVSVDHTERVLAAIAQRDWSEFIDAAVEICRADGGDESECEGFRLELQLATPTQWRGHA